MASEMNKLRCLESITVSEPTLQGTQASSRITVKDLKGKKSTFQLMARYDTPVDKQYLPLVRMAFTIPLLNYGLFTKKFILEYPISTADLNLLNDLNIVFSKDTFVNNIMKWRTNFIKPDYLPRKDKVTVKDAKPWAVFQPRDVVKDMPLGEPVNHQSCGILSSGGKESLLTYAMLREMGVEVHPFYVNESGGHWRTALTAYRYHKQHEPRTYRVWTNIDQLYLFVCDHLEFIRPDHRRVKADTYAIRSCVFPYYIFLYLPVFIERRVGNILLGSEFDDLRHVPSYLGIVHYYGVYDQEQSYDLRMLEWFEKRIPGMNQWSAVRGISGLIVERILVKRYPQYAALQRSCHSCHLEKGEVVPCGTCSKCAGILLYLLANGFDPRILNYTEKAIAEFPKNIGSTNLRLDSDEKDQSFYLLKGKGDYPAVHCIDHVERIHVRKETCDQLLVPEQFRFGLLNIMEQYTNGYTVLEGEHWVPMEKSQISDLLMRKTSVEPS